MDQGLWTWLGSLEFSERVVDLQGVEIFEACLADEECRQLRDVV